MPSYSGEQGGSLTIVRPNHSRCWVAHSSTHRESWWLPQWPVVSEGVNQGVRILSSSSEISSVAWTRVHFVMCSCASTAAVAEVLRGTMNWESDAGKLSACALQEIRPQAPSNKKIKMTGNRFTSLFDVCVLPTCHAVWLQAA
jgi:hypothetical protein